jgi:hypothetical protein
MPDEGCGRGLIEILSRHLLGAGEEMLWQPQATGRVLSISVPARALMTP